MRIAITGASGQLGRLIIERLRTKVPSSDIVALVRTPSKATDLGVEVREADYTRPDTLDKALAGVDTLLMISGSEVGQRVAQHRNIIDAAKKAGIKRVVYTSLLHAERSTLSLAPEHVETEALLNASGLSITLLRNGWYTENYTASVGPAVANGAFIGSAGQGKIASAPRADYADAAVVVLTTAGHEGKTYELAGDSAYTLAELAAEISRQTGKDIPYKDLPPADYTAALTAAGLPAPWPEALASFDVEAAKGALFDEGRALSTLIGRPTTSLKDSVAAALKQA
ncbi:SDR family oxidoreductase [Pusillimonas sp. DMV24BSW_D]|uniref:SDR family oxidoreductase n=1 Tax=Neopusillimonas aestuarii TaxID=2716226 RepID=UPI000C5BD5CC|nr:SDR family oxidoreductase [Pusillimonas sp. DMV24BSW_D]MAL00685.1 NAD(P)-dependent oxidoreductase [Alcaligenaceae bacterium]MAO50757.1 NAD(P)-dependent oxidoreductase [Pusillimonas sp.]QIM48341.1 SDR family oxidoreductase [Pusillimonas sp. DMV24BSW_D]HCP78038.1 NAD(P)-dependent oxidoreductase [Pusillimonas sp.]|tara:strand:+ start:605 stop:1456 length:852 start_codon:yes stop_codon:yes gene_type:complete